MFASTLLAELATRINSVVEIALVSTQDETELIEGILSSVSGELITIIQTPPYGPGSSLTIQIQDVNFVRFPQAA